MKTLIFLLAIFATFSTNAYEMCLIPQQNIVEARGCCSSHGGVCGCSMGQATCCDGSLSPSCGC